MLDHWVMRGIRTERDGSQSRAYMAFVPGLDADKGMYFIWDFTQLNVRPHSRVGLLKYKTAPKCSLSGPFRHSGVGRNPGAVGPVRSYNLNFTYPCQPSARGSVLSNHTNQNYARAWTAFSRWCGNRGIPALPARPGGIVMYLD